MSANSLAPDARFIWPDPVPALRLAVAFFRRKLQLPDLPESAELSLYAETWYRLSINGTVIGHGPARAVAGVREFDTYDLRPWLKSGANTILVEVHRLAQGTFQSLAAESGFIAWGQVRQRDGGIVSLHTPGDWTAIASEAHDPAMLRASFALPPVESVDLRRVPTARSEWAKPRELTAPAWQSCLSPRTIPLLDESEVEPPTSWKSDLQPASDLTQWICHRAAFGPGRPPRTVGLVCYIRSPRTQRVTALTSAGVVLLNSERVPVHEWARSTVLRPVELSLATGWNRLALLAGTAGDAQEFALRLPAEAGLSIGAEPNIDCAAEASLVGPWPSPAHDAALRLDELLSAGPARAVTAAGRNPSPFMHHEIDRVESSTAAPASLKALQKVTFFADFGTEVLGRPVLEFETAPGTVIDVATAERRDGNVVVLNVQGTQTVDRCIARGEGGSESWQGFYPRGFRYLQITVRGDAAGFHLRRLAVRRANYPVQPLGRFECSDPLLNRIWAVGRDTEHACMTDAFIDCPWREQALYTGDLLVQYLVNLAAFGDHQLMRRCLHLLFATQHAQSGLLAPCAHGLPPGRHVDYTAIAVSSLERYRICSGDPTLPRALAEPVMKVLDGLAALAAPGSPLIDGSAWSPYIDRSHTDREGVSCALNCFYAKALADGETMLRAVGQDDAAERCAARAAAVGQAIRETFWDPDQRVFLDRRRSDVAQPTASVVGNVLPALFGIADAPQSDGALQYVLAAMAENRRTPHPARDTDFNVSVYFSFYALELLYRTGHAKAAERFIRDNWGRMLEAGAWTWWEFFLPNHSLCHAWAASPTYFLSARVLGVMFPEPENADLVAIEPHPGTLSWARGAYPHPRGLIEVEWRYSNGRLQVDCCGPQGVHFVPASRYAPMDLRVRPHISA
jgi:alpha-L-rhamnosidase